MSKISTYIITFLLLSSCQEKQFEDEQAMLKFLKQENQDYYQQKTINAVNFSLLYRPTDLIVEQSLNNNGNDSKTIDSLRRRYGKYLYFNLSISKDGQELLSTTPRDRNEFGAMVNQLAFGMGQYVHLYTDTKDTIPLTDYVYPRMYGMSRKTSMLFVYPREEALKGNNLTFSIEDLGLITGEVKFKIPTEKIKKQPTLKFKG